MLWRSPTVAFCADAAVDLSAGTDSPVSAASSVRRFFTSARRRSAGILSPDSSSTTSPGTSCFGRDHARLAAAQGAGLGGEHVADGVQRLLRLALLDEAEQGVDEDTTPRMIAGVDPQAQHQLGEAGAEQDVDEDIVELGEEAHQAARAACRPAGGSARTAPGGRQPPPPRDPASDRWKAGSPPRRPPWRARRARQPVSGSGSMPRLGASSVRLGDPSRDRAQGSLTHATRA